MTDTVTDWAGSCKACYARLQWISAAAAAPVSNYGIAPLPEKSPPTENLPKSGKLSAGGDFSVEGEAILYIRETYIGPAIF